MVQNLLLLLLLLLSPCIKAAFNPRQALAREQLGQNTNTQCYIASDVTLEDGQGEGGGSGEVRRGGGGHGLVGWMDGRLGRCQLSGRHLELFLERREAKNGPGGRNQRTVARQCSPPNAPMSFGFTRCVSVSPKIAVQNLNIANNNKKK